MLHIEFLFAHRLSCSKGHNLSKHWPILRWSDGEVLLSRVWKKELFYFSDSLHAFHLNGCKLARNTITEGGKVHCPVILNPYESEIRSFWSYWKRKTGKEWMNVHFPLQYQPVFSNVPVRYEEYPNLIQSVYSTRLQNNLRISLHALNLYQRGCRIRTVLS